MNVRTRLLAGTATALGFAAAMASAQTGPQEPNQLWGVPISANNTQSQVIRAMGDQLGIIRSNQLLWNQLNAVEFTANGQWVDLEAGSIGEMQPVSRYTYQASYQIPASRLDVEGPGIERIVRVVRGDLDQAWDESRPGYPTGDAENAAFREATIWLWPHAFARAVAYAEQGRCPDGSECEVALDVSEEGESPVITVEIDGREYRGTIGEDGRPASIEAEIDIPGVGASSYVANYANYRNGLGLGTSGEDVAPELLGREVAAATDVPLARGAGILDKYHTGAYFPSNVTHEVDGQPVLEVEITEGWPNRFMIFPTPELLASAE